MLVFITTIKVKEYLTTSLQRQLFGEFLHIYVDNDNQNVEKEQKLRTN